MAKNITAYTDNYGAQVLRHPNNETKWSMRGSVSKPLNPKRFDIGKNGVSNVANRLLTKGITRGS
jgi:hypothetical protein